MTLTQLDSKVLELFAKIEEEIREQTPADSVKIDIVIFNNHPHFHYYVTQDPTLLGNPIRRKVERIFISHAPELRELTKEYNDKGVIKSDST